MEITAKLVERLLHKNSKVCVHISGDLVCAIVDISMYTLYMEETYDTLLTHLYLGNELIDTVAYNRTGKGILVNKILLNIKPLLLKNSTTVSNKIGKLLTSLNEGYRDITIHTYSDHTHVNICNKDENKHIGIQLKELDKHRGMYTYTINAGTNTYTSDSCKRFCTMNQPLQKEGVTIW